MLNRLRRTLKLTLSIGFALILLQHGSIVLGQFDHSDVDFRYEDSQIVTNQRVYDSYFPTFGITKQFSSNPGFASETDADGGIGNGDNVVYHVLDNLIVWDESGFFPPPSETQIRIQNNPPQVPDTIVSGQSGVQLGSVDPATNRIGSASGSGDFHSHVNFFLESPEEVEIPNGAYGIKLSLMSSNDQITDSDPMFFVYNFGLSEEVFETGMGAYLDLLETPTLDGDFDNNGELEAFDIDLLSERILENRYEPVFDLNSDGILSSEDRRVWVEDLKYTYFGDANLDGEFTSTDLVAVFQSGEYEDSIQANSSWSDGDWSGDQESDSSDLVLAFQSGGYELGPRAAAVIVPEPGANGFLFAFVALLMMARSKPRDLRAYFLGSK